MLDQIYGTLHVVAVYEVKPGRIQIEARGRVMRLVYKLRVNGFSDATGVQDHMGDEPYSLIRVSGKQFQQSAMNDYMAEG